MDPVTIYYFQGATGWGSTFDGVPAFETQPLNTPLAITGEPQNVLAHAHDPVSFNVNVNGTSPIYYQWSLNGTNIPGATNGFLNISNVNQSLLGAYAVAITNAYGTTNSSVANLYLYPYLAIPFRGLITDWGFTNTLSVGAWGTGPLFYQWLKNGTIIPNATNSTLTFANIQFTNAGFYSVIVSNQFGSVTNTPQQVVVNPAGVSLGFCPALTITGVVGFSYIIQSTTDLANTNAWVTLTNLTMTQPVLLWVDTNVDASSPSDSKTFYRVLPGQ